MEGIIADVILICIPIVTIVLGWKKGLFRSLGELVALFLALVVAHHAAVFAADEIIDRSLRPATHETIREQVSLMLESELPSISEGEALRRILDAIPSGYVRDRAQELVETLDLSLREAVTEGAGDRLADMGIAVADRVLDTAVNSLLFAVLYLLIFLAADILLKVLLRALNLTMRLPVLKQLNQAGGVLFGAMKGIVIACAGVWLLCSMGIIIQESMVESSLLLRRMIQWMSITNISGM